MQSDKVEGTNMDIAPLNRYFANILVFIACWLAPGLGIIALYFPAALTTMDLPRLLIFAVALPAPVLFSGMIFYASKIEHQETLQLQHQESVGEFGFYLLIAEKEDRRPEGVFCHFSL